MTDYKLNVQPGKVVKETYSIQVEKVVHVEMPEVNGEFSAPYVATLNLPLGEEKISISTNYFKDYVIVDSKRYNNNTKKQRLLNLGKVIKTIVSDELKSIFKGNTQSCLVYKGLPAEADEAVHNAEKQFYELLHAYNRELITLPQQTVDILKRQTTNIVHDGTKVTTETIDDKL